MSRSIATAVVLAGVAAGCNSLLGVTDVVSSDGSLVAPACGVDPQFPRLSTESAPASSLVHGTSGPSLLIVLNGDAKPDGLFLQLYDNMGGHNAVNAPGSYQLLAGDAALSSCGVCVSIGTNFDRSASTFDGYYFALAQGKLQLTVADNTRMAGTLQDLKLRHVDAATESLSLDDGCFVTIGDVEFDRMYSTTAQAAPPGIVERRAAAETAAAQASEAMVR